MLVNKILILIVLIIPTVASSQQYESKEGMDIVGTKAPEFEGLTWLNTAPFTIEELRGKVVLIRFWLVGCPYCMRSAPSLVEFYENYSDKGFVVIGIHHPKSEQAKDNKLVKKQAEAFGFKFPIAQDSEWKTINSYWLGGKKRSFTSSSILIDKNGIIRFVHDGGDYYKTEYDREANATYEAMKENIARLLDE